MMQASQGRSVSPRGTCGLVAMTSASHAEGRQFDPGQVYCRAIAMCDGSCRLESHGQNSCQSRCARDGRLNILSHGLPTSYASCLLCTLHSPQSFFIRQLSGRPILRTWLSRVRGCFWNDAACCKSTVSLDAFASARQPRPQAPGYFVLKPGFLSSDS
jgi:hypothetical protein